MARHTQKVQMVDYINLSHFIHTVENDKAVNKWNINTTFSSRDKSQ